MYGRSLFIVLMLTVAFSGTAQAQQQNQESDSQVVIEVLDAERQGGRPTDGLTLQRSIGPCPGSFCVDVAPSTAGANKTVTFTIRIFKLSTGETVPNSSFSFSWEPVTNTGGHAHSANRPKGTFSPSSGNTGPSGIATITYTAPQVSGQVIATVTCSSPGSSTCLPFRMGANTLVNGLVELGPGTNYDLVGQTGTHPLNHFGTPAFNQALVNLANAYAARFPGSKVAFNDMSLEFGGLFDISAGWAPPHRTHRWGKNVDFRLVPVARRNATSQIIRAQNLTTLVEGDHWHLTLP